MQEKDFGLILVMYPHTGFEKYCGDLMVVIAVYKLYNWSKKVVSLLFDSDTKLSDKEMHSRYEKFLKDSKLQAELSEIRVELSKYNCLIEPLDDFDDDEINQVDKPKNTQFVLDNLSQFIHRFEIHQIPQNLDAFTLFSQWTFKYMKNMIGIATEIDGLFMSRSLAEKFHLLNTANSIKTLSRGSISCYFKMIDQGKINPGGDLNKMEILSMTNRIKGSKKSTVTGSEFYQCCLCLAEVSRVFPTDGYGMRIINKGSKCFTCHRLGFHLNTFSWNVDCPSTNQCVYPVIDCLYRLWINRFQKRSSLISTVSELYRLFLLFVDENPRHWDTEPLFKEIRKMEDDNARDWRCKIPSTLFIETLEILAKIDGNFKIIVDEGVKNVAYKVRKVVLVIS